MANTTKTRKAMYDRITQHGKALLAIFPHATRREPVALCKALRRYEKQGNSLAMAACNTPEGSGAWETESERLRLRVARLLGESDAPWFINGDPRGYCLKIDDNWTRSNAPDLYRDWGGYGIIAPDLSDH